MKSCIQMSEVRYIIKKDNGIIICKIKAKTNIDNRLDVYTIFNTRFMRQFHKKYQSWSSTPRVFTGIARLAKGDTWDEAQGKRIAESKCKRKIYHFYIQMYKMILELILKEADTVNKVLNFTKMLHTVETIHSKELML